MPSFADSFWTADYQTGLDALFDKLLQGCTENAEFISLFTSRMNYELDYGTKLSLVHSEHKSSAQGFDRDDGASLKNAFKGISEQMSNEGEIHITVGMNIKQMVIEPFGKWSMDHSQRVGYSQEILKSSLKVYQNKDKLVTKVQKKYFQRCRAFESLKHGKTDEEVLKELSMEDEEGFMQLGEVQYGQSELKVLLTRLLKEIPQTSVKVPILGSYDRVSTGSQIASFLQQSMKLNLDQCEQFGNDLITNGLLRKINTSVGSTIGQNVFVNSGSFHYQWKELGYNLTQLPLDENYPTKVSSYIDDLKSSFEEPSLKKLNREVKELDTMYQKEVRKLDKIRCDLEELIIDHLTFMEKCEMDRLRALKKVIMDFSACISNNITAIKSSIDKILVYEESISPEKDLLFLLQNYRKGPFAPQVTLYDNYYNSFQDQIFGVDLETRCKNDNKTVPVIVSSILSYMDTVYPELPDDEVRTKTWTIPVRLQSTHALRAKVEEVSNDGLTNEFWSEFEPEVIASVLKIYLLELPDSLVPNSVYEVIKLIYTELGNDTEQRIVGISNVLKDLDRSRVSTLNVICTHFQRLISILNESAEGSTLAQTFQDGISQEFSSCVLRPKQHTSITVGDKHPFRFMNDLLIHRKDVMKLIKRSASVRGEHAQVQQGIGNDNGVKRRDSTLQSRLKQAVNDNSRKSSSSSVLTGSTLTDVKE